MIILPNKPSRSNLMEARESEEIEMLCTVSVLYAVKDLKGEGKSLFEYDC